MSVGGSSVISTDCPRPARKMLRTVDGPLLHIITKAYNLHMFLSLANLKIHKILKNSSTRCKITQLSTYMLCSVRTQRAASQTGHKHRI